MNTIESAAARHLADPDGGIIRPLEIALGKSPTLTVLIMTPAAQVHAFTFEVHGGSDLPSAGAVAGYGEMGVDELVGQRQHIMAGN